MGKGARHLCASRLHHLGHYGRCGRRFLGRLSTHAADVRALVGRRGGLAHFPVCGGPDRDHYDRGATQSPSAQIGSLTIPKIDDSAAEELIYTYDALANVKTLTGAAPIVTFTLYSPLGEITQREMGSVGKKLYDLRLYEGCTRRITKHSVLRETWHGHCSVPLRLSVAEKLTLAVDLDHLPKDRTVAVPKSGARKQSSASCGEYGGNFGAGAQTCRSDG